MNRRIAIFLGKGGVAKTTTAWALSSFLSKRCTLAVDTDPQGTLTNAILTEMPNKGVYNVFAGSAALESMVRGMPHYGDGLAVLAATPNLSTLEQNLAELDRLYRLKDTLCEYALDQIVEFTILDTPPSSTSLMTVASLVAATHVLTPVSMDAAALEQLPAFERLFTQIRRLNPHLRWIGILPTRFDARRRLDNEVLAEVSKKHVVVFPPIAESVRVKEAMAMGLPANRGAVESIFKDSVSAIIKEVERE